MRPTIFSRSYPQVSLEGFSKRGHGSVASGGGNDAQLVITPLHAYGSCIEPEACQIAERRLTDQLRELFRESGPREGDAISERSNSPRLMRLVMEQRQCSADLLIPQSSQPSGLGGINIFIQIGADSLHEQNVGQSCDDRRRSCTARIQLLQDMHDRRSEPRSDVFASPLDMDDRRKNRKKRVGRAILKLHSATHQFRDRSLAAGAKCPLVVGGAALEQVEKINTLSRWQVSYDMRVTSRYDHKIAGG